LSTPCITDDFEFFQSFKCCDHRSPFIKLARQTQRRLNASDSRFSHSFQIITNNIFIHTINMSGRLDQSLDSIIDSQKKAKRGTDRRRKPTKTRAAPVGGVKKAVKPAKSAVKPAGGASGSLQPSKIVVSGLV
jgi:hypothetical protein